MGRGTFRRIIKKGWGDSPGIDNPLGTLESQGADSSLGTLESQGALKREVGIFTDKSVCQVLGIRRRILAKARTLDSRGRNWDSVGQEVGMTWAWIKKYAAEHGISVDVSKTELEPVSGDYVSVRHISNTPNVCVVLVEREIDGKRELARTRNVSEHPIYGNEVFTCIRTGLPSNAHLEWIARPNEIKY